MVSAPDAIWEDSCNAWEGMGSLGLRMSLFLEAASVAENLEMCLTVLGQPLPLSTRVFACSVTLGKSFPLCASVSLSVEQGCLSMK